MTVFAFTPIINSKRANGSFILISKSLHAAWFMFRSLTSPSTALLTICCFKLAELAGSSEQLCVCLWLIPQIQTAVGRKHFYEASSPIQESNLISLRLVEREQTAVKLGIWRRSATKALRINMNERVSMSCDQRPLIYVFLVWKRLKVSLKSFLLVEINTLEESSGL